MLLDINSFFYSLGHFLESMMEGSLVIIAPYFNVAVICLGFFGLFYWLVKQGKYNKEAKNNKGQIK